MTQRTPGPWETAYRQRFDGMWAQEIFGSDNELVATAAWAKKPADEQEMTGTWREENARLIAAAPDLLGALEGLIPVNVNLDHPLIRDDEIVPCDLTMGELRKARAAIAKATGR